MTHYILSKNLGALKARVFPRKLSIIVDPLSLSDTVTNKALNDDKFSDFDDSLQYHSALKTP